MSKRATSVLDRSTTGDGQWPEALTPERLEPMQEQTPVLACDTSVIENRYLHMRKCLPDVEVFYAVKSNPAPAVLSTLATLGASFEIASMHELDLVEAAGGHATGSLYSNPVKPPAHVAASFARGIRRFGFDGVAELHKLARHAPGSRVFVRLRVDDQHSLFPLSQKFGTSIDEGFGMLLLARELGLEPYGVTFHVGSQCTDADAWTRAIAQCGVLMGKLHREDVHLHMLDIGGGFPASYGDPIPAFTQIAKSIRGALRRLPHRPPLVVSEPGRYLVAESGVMVATVIGVDIRSDGPWCYLDVGGYNGLMETVQTGGRWSFPLRATRADDAAQVAYTVTGPSCDSTDTMFYGVQLPADLEVGERLYIGSAGAYTTSYASSFNGFSPPRTLFTDGQELPTER